MICRHDWNDVVMADGCLLAGTIGTMNWKVNGMVWSGLVYKVSCLVCLVFGKSMNRADKCVAVGGLAGVLLLQLLYLARFLDRGFGTKYCEGETPPFFTQGYVKCACVCDGKFENQPTLQSARGAISQRTTPTNVLKREPSEGDLIQWILINTTNDVRRAPWILPPGMECELV